jgi:uncharacterized protein DUF1488
MNIVRELRNIADWSKSVTKPRSDGTRVLFETEIDGRMVSCTISRGALQELCGCHHIASGDLLRRFVDGRDRIEQIATDIFVLRPKGVSGTLHIWADDIYDPPSGPAIARQAALRIESTINFTPRYRASV